MARGRKTGGRTKGTPNRVTSAAREAFFATFNGLEGELEDWIRQTANGWDQEVQTKLGPVVVRTGKDPGKAADLLIRMAEYHFPKQARLVDAEGKDAPLIVNIIKEGA